MGKSMEDQMINLKMAQMKFKRDAKKFAKQSKAEESRVRKAMLKGDYSSAEIHSNNSVSFKNNADRSLALSYRIENAYNMLNSGNNMKMVSKTMKNIVTQLEKSSTQEDLEGMTNVMEQFETQTGNMALRRDYMEKAMDSASGKSLQRGKAVGLMQKIADEQGLDFSAEMDRTGQLRISPPEEKSKSNKEKELEDRLKMLDNI